MAVSSPWSPRVRQGVVALAVGALLLAGGVVAYAANPDACDAVYGANTIANLKKYEACRFARIDASQKRIEDKLNAGPTPTPSPTDTPTTPSPTDTPTTPSPDPTTQPPSPTPTDTPTPTQPPAPSGVCDPAKAIVTFDGQGSAGLGQYDDNSNNYDASAEMWGTDGYNYQQLMAVCSHNSWSLDVTTDNTKGDGAVKAYPSMRRIYWDYGSATGNLPKLSTFPKSTIDFAAKGPGACAGCIYDTAFDLWFDGIADSTSVEVMVWTENVKQVPSGTKVASGIQFSGHTWDLWSADNNHYLAYLPTDAPAGTSGTLDVKALVADLSSRGRLEADPHVGQLSYGVETVSTGAVKQHWDFTTFDIHDGS